MGQFSIEITLDERGIRVIRLHTDTWDEATRGEAFLEALRPSLQRLDEAVKALKIGAKAEKAVQ